MPNLVIRCHAVVCRDYQTPSSRLSERLVGLLPPQRAQGAGTSLEIVLQEDDNDIEVLLDLMYDAGRMFKWNRDVPSGSIQGPAKAAELTHKYDMATPHAMLDNLLCRMYTAGPKKMGSDRAADNLVYSMWPTPSRPTVWWKPTNFLKLAYQTHLPQLTSLTVTALVKLIRQPPRYSQGSSGITSEDTQELTSMPSDVLGELLDALIKPL